VQWEQSCYMRTDGQIEITKLVVALRLKPDLCDALGRE